jgi:molybdopterin synthase catalytic subunit
MIELCTDPIDPQRALAHVASPAAGAVVLFLGTVREISAGRRSLALDYHCYPAMAHRQFEQLEADARRRWPIIGCAILHRLGHLELGDVSVAIAVSTAHRQAAFAAGQWLIDTIKQTVPIWKKEYWADGSSEWVHPGIEPAVSTAGQPLREEGT